MEHCDEAEYAKERRPLAPVELQSVAKARTSRASYAGVAHNGKLMQVFCICII